MKKLLLFIFVSFIFVISLNATEIGHNSEGYERKESNNYGISKKININSSNLDNIKNTPYVDASIKVYDFANILSSEDEKELKSLIEGFYNETNLEFVFVSVDMAYDDDLDNERYAQDFYDYNDFGLNTTKNGGIILIRNKYESNPYYVAVLTGEAQLYCNEGCLDNLLDNVYESFHSGNYKAGIESFIHMFKTNYNKGYDEDKYYIDENGSLREKKELNYIPSIISGALATLFGMLGLVKKNKMVKKASNANDYLVKSSIDYINKSDKLVSTITTHHRISSNSGGGGSHSGFGSSGVGHISGGRHG